MNASSKDETAKLSSKAWLQHGPKGMFGFSEPGVLLAIGDRVSFTTKKGPMFQADRTEITVKWPRVAMGYQVNLTVGGKIYRLALSRPKNAVDVDDSLFNLAFSPAHGELGEAIGGIVQLFKDRDGVKAWHGYFGAETAEHGRTAPEEA